MHKDTPNEWFESWFDSPYYHILYQHRDEQEAQFVIDQLTSYLNIPIGSTILDLACGKGRHANYLASLGFDVAGYDLSKNNIALAKENQKGKVHFLVHDMREKFPEKFDAIFNLFTSFGYFDCKDDNVKTLQAIKESLTENGIAVIDFLNLNFVKENLVPSESITLDGITFSIERRIDNNFIYKKIRFEVDGKNYHFTEKVQALGLADFEEMLEKAGMYLLDVFGDYKLTKFDQQKSERLILIFQ